MKTAQSLQQWQSVRDSLPGTLGFIPTMGALHEGHFSLIERAQKECDSTVVSIFVNPTQFDEKSDLKNYPNKLNEDLQRLEQLKVDAVFLPNYKIIYPLDYRYQVQEKEVSSILCGRYRKGHFSGVLTVVLKLFNIVRPGRAYFGEKDYQQLRLIQDMVSDLFLSVEIVACPIIRERDGLAMSSRNLHLSTEERSLAPLFYKSLVEANGPDEAVRRLEESGFKVDYVEEYFGRRFGAVFLGDVRLIDNVAL